MEDLKKQIQSVIDAFKTKDLTKAELLCKKLIVTNPRVAFLYNLYGLILAEQKRPDDAIEYYEKGLKIDPNFAMIYNNLGLLFFTQKRDKYIEKAENLYKKSISLNKEILEPHVNLGNLYNLVNKNEDAINCYKTAININPKSAYIYHNLANVYVSIGKFEEAKINFKEAIKLNPNFLIPHRSLSRIIKYTDKEEHFNELNRVYKNINIENSEDKMDIAFALGKACEDIKDFDKSFSFYKEANSIRRKKINFSLKKEKTKFEEIKITYDKKLFDKYKVAGCVNTSPIFIVGMPRSGTTLVEQILSSHDDVFGADEVEFIPNLIHKNFKNHNLQLFFMDDLIFSKENLKGIGEEYISKMKSISQNSKRTTDKLPTNFLSIGFIKLILPNSKIIHCSRNPKDNIISIFKNNFSGDTMNFAYDLNDIIEYYNLYNDLMKYWKDLLPNFIFNIKYEKLITETKKEIHNLLNFCDLDWSNDCLKFYQNTRPIKTASDIQVRNKIYKTSVDSWKNYEKYLKEYFLKLRN